ncbi:hypothetical protein BX616_005225, partial [Lobosporangium transversale]
MVADTTTPPTQQLEEFPILENYDVSSFTGFAPYPYPLARLTQPYYQPWEEIMDQLNILIDARLLRSAIDQ